MDNLQIPYGLNNDGNLVSALQADKENIYVCPSCEEKLILRSGEIRKKHFSHPQGSSCNLETILHKTAKKLIKQAIDENAKNNKPLCLNNFCHSCGVQYSITLPSKTFSSASLETKISNYICDVIAYKNTKMTLAIEILVTHKVDDKKAKELPIFWVELNAEDVLNDPYKWNPTQSKLKQNYCPDCKADIKHIYSVADKWKINRELYSPIKNPEISTYIAGTCSCFKCKQVIPVFWWNGVPFSEKEPPNPKPITIKRKYSKQYDGSYWANTCPNCKVIQGDNHVFLFDNAPLNGLPLSSASYTSESGHLNITSGDSVVSQFMKIVNRNLE